VTENEKPQEELSGEEFKKQQLERLDGLLRIIAGILAEEWTKQHEGSQPQKFKG
jgi:hypothetical protein